MERLLIKGIQMFKNTTEVKWERWGGEPDALMVSGSWLVEEGIIIAGVLEYAKSHVDKGVEIKVDLEPR
jgi:hypothetical protein